MEGTIPMTCADGTGTIGHLEQLGQELAHRGWIASLQEPAGRNPSLYVQNPDPEAAALNDHVLVAPDGGGNCWFWWPWASRISPASQIPEAAARIAHVLRATDDHRATSM
jgi:hypothetical protein